MNVELVVGQEVFARHEDGMAPQAQLLPGMLRLQSGSRPGPQGPSHIWLPRVEAWSQTPSGRACALSGPSCQPLLTVWKSVACRSAPAWPTCHVSAPQTVPGRTCSGQRGRERCREKPDAVRNDLLGHASSPIGCLWAFS